MNSVLEAIRTRRSVRSYEELNIPRDIVEVIIEAGNQAPSSLNSQPWRFVVVEDKKVKKKLLKAARPQAKNIIESLKTRDPEKYEARMKRFEEMEDPIYYSAPVVLFVVGHGRYADHSCPLACQNMMLAAHSLGLGSCWVGFGSMVTEDPDVIEILELKEDEKIFGPIILGYPKDIPEPPEKKPPIVKWV